MISNLDFLESFRGGRGKTDGGGLAEEVAGAGGDDEGGGDVGGCGGWGTEGGVSFWVDLGMWLGDSLNLIELTMIGTDLSSIHNRF